MKTLFLARICTVFFAAVYIFSASKVSAQTNITGVVNAYAEVTAIDTFCLASFTVTSSAGFKKGDTVMVIQMKGASINTSNTTSFGTINSYGLAGNYEMNVVLAVSATSIALENILIKPYDPAGIMQIVRVPTYKSANVTGTLTAAPWNGKTGGILALMVKDTLTLSAGAAIDVSGKGFRKGDSSVNTSSTSFMTDFYYPAGTSSGNKGEGIALLPVGYEAGRGADANGGGGGNGNGAGGAGGGNFGLGGGGGGQMYLSSIDNGGLAGKSLTYSNPVNKIFMGGGGGGGFQNNTCGTSGGAGGGIVFIRASTLVGNNRSITSNGKDGGFSSCNDGTGGGGAGGTMVFDVQNFSGLLTVNTNGGDGGDNPNTGDGPGGGGGGGMLWISGSGTLPGNVTHNAIPGKHGVNNNPVNLGLADGQAGGFLNGLKVPQSQTPTVFNVNPGPDTTICAGMSIKLNDVHTSGGSTYSWSPAAGLSCTNCPSPIATPTVTTTYQVVAYNGPCLAILSVVITIGGTGGSSAGVVSASPDTVCQGTPVTLVTTGSAGSLQWQSSASASSGFTNIPGATSANYNSIPLMQTTYFRTVAGVGNCSDTSAAFKIYVPPALVAAFTYTLSGKVASFNSGSSTGSITFYTWDFGDGGTSLAINPQHTYALNDTFNVCLTIYDGSNCSFTYCQDIIVGGSTGATSLIGEQDIDVYPNPVSNQLTLSGHALTENAEVMITDVLGRTVFTTTATQQPTLKLDVSALANGVYYLKVINADGSYVKPVIKK